LLGECFRVGDIHLIVIQPRYKVGIRFDVVVSSISEAKTGVHNNATDIVASIFV
jgi:hypothetical protein